MIVFIIATPCFGYIAFKAGQHTRCWIKKKGMG